jgi:hypothetical protein
MANFAVIKNGTVSNLIVAESLQIATEATGFLCVEIEDITQVAIGDQFEQTQ